MNRSFSSSPTSGTSGSTIKSCPSRPPRGNPSCSPSRAINITTALRGIRKSKAAASTRPSKSWRSKVCFGTRRPAGRLARDAYLAVGDDRLAGQHVEHQPFGRREPARQSPACPMALGLGEELAARRLQSGRQRRCGRLCRLAQVRRNRRRHIFKGRTATEAALWTPLTMASGAASSARPAGAAATASTSVPEPTAIWLMLLGFCVQWTLAIRVKTAYVRP